MNQDPKAILLKILEIIDYQDDKNQFALEFIDLCCRKAILSAVGSLPPDKKQLIDEGLKDNKDLDKCIEVLQTTVGRDLYQQHLEEESKNMFVDYIQTIIPTLTPEKQGALNDYLATLANQNKPQTSPPQ